MIDALSEGIEKSSYVDDLAVYCQSGTMAITDVVRTKMTLNFLPQKRCVCILATQMAYNLSLVLNAMDNSFMLSIFIGVFF